MNFDLLLNTIQQTHTVFQQNAVKAVNMSLTLRNWLIGYYIVEFEQNGEDRAKYGDKLIPNLVSELNSKSLSFRNLNLFRQFYLLYPQIVQTLSAQLEQLELNSNFPIMQSASAQLENQETVINKTAEKRLEIPPQKLISNLSFSHLVELFPIKDPL